MDETINKKDLDLPTPVSKVPIVTDELLAVNAEQQKAWSAGFELRKGSQRGYASSVIASNLQILDSLEVQLRDASDEDKPAIEAVIIRKRNDVAVWAESIGEFDLAARCAVKEIEHKRLLALIVAQTRPDAEWCEHALFEYADGDMSQIAVREFDFYSPTHGKNVSMLKCTKCGFRNARDNFDELKKLSEYRAKAVKAGKHGTESLAEIITGERHDTDTNNAKTR